MKNPFLCTYRVLEIKKGDDTAKYYPQVRKWFWIWQSIMEEGYQTQVQTRRSLEEANEFLYNIFKKERKNKTVGKKAYEFNAVFYKLGQSDQRGSDGRPFKE